MALRYITRNLFQMVTNRTIQRQIFHPEKSFRSFASLQTNNGEAYRDLNRFLEKEIQLEKNAQKHPSQLPKIPGFNIQNNGPEVILTNQSGNEKVTVTFNITNSVNATDSDEEPNLEVAGQQQLAENISQTPGQLKSRPSFTVDINRGGQTLSFLCSYLPHDYAGLPNPEQHHQRENDDENLLEDFQIDEFAIHDGEWNEKVYGADGSVVDGELYDKLLNLLEEHGIGEGL